jgi:hypothetical protein
LIWGSSLVLELSLFIKLSPIGHRSSWRERVVSLPWLELEMWRLSSSPHSMKIHVGPGAAICPLLSVLIKTLLITEGLPSRVLHRGWIFKSQDQGTKWHLTS